MLTTGTTSSATRLPRASRHRQPTCFGSCCAAGSGIACSRCRSLDNRFLTDINRTPLLDRNENVFAYREYYQPNALISTHRANIAALSKGERYEQDLADPSIFHQMPMKNGGRWSVSDEYGEVLSQPRHTAIFWRPADNNELGTRNRINEFLWFDPERIHPVTKERGAARLFFVKRNESYPNGVQHILRETRAQRRVKIGTDSGRPVFSDERDPNIADHGYDVLRYAVAAREPAPTDKSNRVEGTFSQAQRHVKRFRQAMTIR